MGSKQSNFLKKIKFNNNSSILTKDVIQSNDEQGVTKKDDEWQIDNKDGTGEFRTEGNQDTYENIMKPLGEHYAHDPENKQTTVELMNINGTQAAQEGMVSPFGHITNNSKTYNSNTGYAYYEDSACGTKHQIPMGNSNNLSQFDYSLAEKLR